MGTAEMAELGSNCPKWKLLSATAIKFIAVVFMFMDHIHQMFATAGAPIWLTMAGRLVFPMFLFTAAESFYYTHNKRKYLQRLLFASWGMTVFTFTLGQIIPNENVVLMNNAFSTLFMAGLYMMFWDWLLEGIKARKVTQIMKSILCCFIPILCAFPILLVGMLSANENIPVFVIRVLAAVSLLVPNILTVEGGFALVLLGVLFYIFRKNRIMQIFVLLLLSVLVYITGDKIQCIMGLAAVPILMYNGKRGYGMKNFFYLFYPAHIGILYIISALMI